MDAVTSSENALEERLVFTTEERVGGGGEIEKRQGAGSASISYCL